jgi:hypothetical protein
MKFDSCHWHGHALVFADFPQFKIILLCQVTEGALMAPLAGSRDWSDELMLTFVRSDGFAALNHVLLRPAPDNYRLEDAESRVQVIHCLCF